ncbi:AraC family transcriptional regulator [Flammeovirga sp. EKP202]|uniref:helix-turn-helix domain-containing protein n=1 Tax=Flammeovirga sp. EKP202 TaxID=2770592 RepID=UPI00165F0B54|nr:helix-turn-helix domain-containing protein [Flammeovirga sp. EKP202]MBD0401230.1 AraC family transcriptional regulator [Flammeovirga sp. EKP202]
MIKSISSIEELYQFIGLKRTPIDKGFDVFTHEETYPGTHKMVSAHRRDFYSIIFLETQQDGEMHIDQNVHSSQRDILFFQSPQHVFSFVRGESMKGFLIFFTPEILLPHVTDVVSEFSFFSTLQNNLVHLNREEKKEIITLLKFILKEKKNTKLVKYLLLSLLEKSKIIFSKQIDSVEETSEKQFVEKFKRLVENNFIEQKSVAFYAEQLNLTANYLNDKIKGYTGLNAKEHITNRILLEAKNMLIYTNMDIAEVSYTLQFSQPSYFGRFFRKHTNVTPKAYREHR